MKPELRDRVLLPILLPLAILALIGAALFGFSRVLLAVTHTAATTIAFIVAAGIVVVSAVAATRSQIRASTLAALAGGVAGVAMLSGGVALAVLAGEEGGEGEPGGPGAVVTLVARDLAFEPGALAVPAGEPFTIAFDNQDPGIQHNVDIFETDEFAGEPLFGGDLVTGVAEIDYEVPSLEPGTFAFRCVVHPQMTGSIEAAEGAGGEGGGGGPAGGVTVSAANLEFDTDVIDLPAEAPSMITFDNRDPGVQHNISIYGDDTLGESLFQGDLITGPDAIEYEIPPLSPGEYYFHCDVHPTMNGTVAVAAGGGAGGPAGEGEGGGQTGGGAGAPGEGPPGATGATGGAPPGTTGGGGVVEPSTVVAEGLAFDTGAVSLPASTAATLTLDNRDPGVPHNVSIYEDESLAVDIFVGDLITGPDEIDYALPAIEAGEYYFQCDVHPNMSGSVTVS